MFRVKPQVHRMTCRDIYGLTHHLPHSLSCISPIVVLFPLYPIPGYLHLLFYLGISSTGVCMVEFFP